MPLQDCVSRAELQAYNQEKGISNYIDPFAQLFCVYNDNSPLMGDYYTIPKSKEVTNKEIETLRADRKNSYQAGFENAIRNTVKDGSQNRDKYNLGDTMKANLLVGKDIVQSNRSVFSFPQADIYGSCNNFYSPRFMENASSECTQSINLNEQCQSTLNPKFYTD